MSFEFKTENEPQIVPENGFAGMESTIEKAGLSAQNREMIMEEGEKLGGVLGNLSDDTKKTVSAGILGLSILAAMPKPEVEEQK